MDEGDLIIDGGNSYYREDIQRAAQPEAQGDPLRRRRHQRRSVRSGAGILPNDRRRNGRRRPVSIPSSKRSPRVSTPPPVPTAVAGNRRHLNRATCIAARTAPGISSRWSTTGSSTALMAAYAEGLAVLHKANVGLAPPSPGGCGDHPVVESGVLPVRHRHHRGGGAVAAGQRDLVLAARPHCPRRCWRTPSWPGFQGRVSDSGEGRWTVMAAIDEAVPAHVLTAALYERFSSRGEGDFARSDPVGDAQGVRRSRRKRRRVVTTHTIAARPSPFSPHADGADVVESVEHHPSPGQPGPIRSMIRARSAGRPPPGPNTTRAGNNGELGGRRDGGTAGLCGDLSEPRRRGRSPLRPRRLQPACLLAPRWRQ